MVATSLGGLKNQVEQVARKFTMIENDPKTLMIEINAEELSYRYHIGGCMPPPQEAHITIDRKKFRYRLIQAPGARCMRWAALRTGLLRARLERAMVPATTNRSRTTRRPCPSIAEISSTRLNQRSTQAVRECQGITCFRKTTFGI